MEIEPKSVCNSAGVFPVPSVPTNDLLKLPPLVLPLMPFALMLPLLVRAAMRRFASCGTVKLTDPLEVDKSTNCGLLPLASVQETAPKSDLPVTRCGIPLIVTAPLLVRASMSPPPETVTAPKSEWAKTDCAGARFSTSMEPLEVLALIFAPIPAF